MTKLSVSANQTRESEFTTCYLTGDVKQLGLLLQYFRHAIGPGVDSCR